MQRWAREESRESHIDGNLDLGTYVAIDDLQILDLCGVFAEAFGAASSLDSYQLDLDAFDWNLGMMNGDVSVERFCHATHC